MSVPVSQDRIGWKDVVGHPVYCIESDFYYN